MATAHFFWFLVSVSVTLTLLSKLAVQTGISPAQVTELGATRSRNMKIAKHVLHGREPLPITRGRQTKG